MRRSTNDCGVILSPPENHLVGQRSPQRAGSEHWTAIVANLMRRGEYSVALPIKQFIFQKVS